MLVGVTFAPFTADEWIHMAAWNPLYRVQSDQAEDVSHQAGTSYLLVARCLDDASVDELIPYLPHAWGIELGNEPSKQQWPLMNAWYRRMIPKIRDTGWGGNILTAGCANLNADTLYSLGQSLDGIWTDIICAWHGYDEYLNKIPALLATLNGRPHAMTESGYRNGYDSSNEQGAADLHAAALPIVEASGSLLYIAYQLHDGGPHDDENDFGLHAHDGHWRPSYDVLQAYAQKGSQAHG